MKLLTLWAQRFTAQTARELVKEAKQANQELERVSELIRLACWDEEYELTVHNIPETLYGSVNNHFVGRGFHVSAPIFSSEVSTVSLTFNWERE